jgi:hypothetical protein
LWGAEVNLSIDYSLLLDGACLDALSRQSFLLANHYNAVLSAWIFLVALFAFLAGIILGALLWWKKKT